MYQNKLVVAIKVGGRILRESDHIVNLPFGSEYSVLIKNLNALRAKFKLAIDGTDATSGTWIIVPANSSVEMERFIANGDWNQGRRFKFIERSSEIEAHRGVKIDDGFVRVEFQVERATVEVPRYREYDVPVPRPWYPPYPYPRRWNDCRYRGANRAAKSFGASTGTFTNTGGATFTASASAGEYPTNSTGITVAGSISHQQFVAGESFETGASDVIVLQLRGVVGGQAIIAPVTVDTRLTCASCGKTSKDAEFCPRCGTALRA